LYVGVLPSKGQQGYQIPSQWRTDLNLGVSSAAQPLFDTVKQRGRGEQQARWAAVGVMFSDELSHRFTKVTTVNHWPDFLSFDNPLISVHYNHGSHFTLGDNSDGITIAIDFA
jgi:hypothetical protein